MLRYHVLIQIKCLFTSFPTLSTFERRGVPALTLVCSESSATIDTLLVFNMFGRTSMLNIFIITFTTIGTDSARLLVLVFVTRVFEFPPTYTAYT